MNTHHDSITFALPPSKEAPGVARREVDRWLVSRGVGPDAASDIVLVVSELATNVIEHTSSEPELEVACADGSVRVALRDRDPSGPAVRGGGADGGFGLQIVARIADRWGWTPTDDGKVVWAEVDLR